MTTEVFADTERRMKRAVEVVRDELSSIRGGRAHPSLVANTSVDYYGTLTPLNQLASITAPEARLIVVQPWDKQALQSIERAIQKSELGLNPASDGNIVRIPIPPLTEERRRELVKVVKQKVEQGRVAVRNVRRDEVDKLRTMEKNKELSQDEARRAQEQVQKLTDKHIGEMDRLGQGKETEIMEV